MSKGKVNESQAAPKRHDQKINAKVKGYFTDGGDGYPHWFDFTGDVFFWNDNFTFVGQCQSRSVFSATSNETVSMFLEYIRAKDTLQFKWYLIENVSADSDYKIRFDAYQRMVAVYIVRVKAPAYMSGYLTIGLPDEEFRSERQGIEMGKEIFD